MPTHLIELFGLFWVALLSASILPFQSELVFAGMHLSGRYSPWALLLFASCGNILGAVLNWFLGRMILQLEDRRWFPIKRTQLQRAQDWFLRYGEWSLLFSWAPVVGDPLTMVAGILRIPLWRFLIWVTIAKTGRYAVLLCLPHITF